MISSVVIVNALDVNVLKKNTINQRLFVFFITFAIRLNILIKKWYPITTTWFLIT